MSEAMSVEVDGANLVQKVVLGECCIQDDVVIKMIQRTVINPMFNKQMNMIRLRHRDQVQRAERKHEDSLVGQLLDQATEADANLHHLFEARSSVLTKSSLDVVIARESSHYYGAVTNRGPRRWLYFGTNHESERICVILNENGAIASLPCDAIVTRSPHVWKGTLLIGEMCIDNDEDAQQYGKATSSPIPSRGGFFNYEPEERNRKYCFVLLDIVSFAGMCGPIQQSKFDIRLKAMRSFVAIATVPWMTMRVANWQKLTVMFSQFQSAFDAVLHYEGQLVNDANLSIKHELCPSVYSGVAAIESKFPSFHIPSSLHLDLLVVVLHPHHAAEQQDGQVSDCKHVRILSHTQWQRIIGDKDGLNRLRCHAGCGCFWHSFSSQWHKSSSHNDNNNNAPATVSSAHGDAASNDPLLFNCGNSSGGLRLTQIMSVSHDDDEQQQLYQDGQGSGLINWMARRFADEQQSKVKEYDFDKDVAERLMEIASSESIARHKKQSVLLTEPLDGRGAPSSRTTKASRSLDQHAHHRKLVDAIALMSVVTFRIMDNVHHSHDGMMTMRDMIPVQCSFLHHKAAASHYDIMQTFQDNYRPPSQVGAATVAELYLKSVQ